MNSPMNLTMNFAMEIQKHFIKKYLPILAKSAAETVEAGGIEGKDVDESCDIFNTVFDKVMSGDLVIQKKGNKKKIGKRKQNNDEENEDNDESKKKPKPKKAPVPKQLWVDFEESKTMRQDGKLYCSYVADKGKNKGKFCGTILTEEHKNCGKYNEECEWVPHTPQEELNDVDGVFRNMRCKKCWTKGKDDNYRKFGSYDKMYLEQENSNNDYGGETENEEEQTYVPEYDDETQNNLSDQETQEVTDEDRY